MSRIEKLIAELCPEGVEFRELGEICKIETGRLNANASVDSGKYLFFTTAKEVSRIDRYRWDTEALLIAGNANVGDVKHYIGKFEAYQRTYVLTDFSKDVDVRFLFFLVSNNLKNYLENRANSAAMTYIILSTLQSFRVPIPPLEVQREIVKVLDTFTQLEAELEAELEARRRQYHHYRDALLNFDGRDDVRWATLGEIATIGTGSRNTNEAVPSGLYPFFVRSQEPLAIDEYEFDETAIITAGDGVGVGKVFHFVDGKYALHQRAYRLCVKSGELHPKFLFHFIRNDFARYLATTSVHASVTSLRKPMFEKYLVPIPPLEEQARIVAILDRFDALVNDLTSGLPAEIEARRKQYQYYRDRLLTFQEKAAA